MQLSARKPQDEYQIACCPNIVCILSLSLLGLDLGGRRKEACWYCLSYFTSQPSIPSYLFELPFLFVKNAISEGRFRDYTYALIPLTLDSIDTAQYPT